jgi:histidinol-phosphate aminotransferase
MRLRTALSGHSGVPVEQIAVGNGSSDMLLALGAALLDEDAEFVYSWPSFSLYPHLPAAAGARGIRVPLDARACHDLQAMAEAVTSATRLVVVCNPNNPTSTALPADEIEAFIAQMPSSTCVLIDEAYCEFNGLHDPTAARVWLERYPNLVLLRTFSKVYSLAGLRCGYALCGHAKTVEVLTRLRQPFACSALAQAAAVAALTEDISWRVRAVERARTQMSEGLEVLGIVPVPSRTNFSWIELDGVGGATADDVGVVAALADLGVIVRSGSALGQARALRVTYGTVDENVRFLEALHRVLRA